jgi:hypothetical protein
MNFWIIAYSFVGSAFGAANLTTSKNDASKAIDFFLFLFFTVAWPWFLLQNIFALILRA